VKTLAEIDEIIRNRLAMAGEGKDVKKEIQQRLARIEPESADEGEPSGAAEFIRMMTGKGRK